MPASDWTGSTNNRRNLAAVKFLLQRIQIAEGYALGTLQHGTEVVPPEAIAHQRQSAAGEAMKRAFAVEQSGPPGGLARELNGRLHSFAAGTGEKDFLKRLTREIAKARREHTRQIGHMALQHRGAVPFELVMKGRDDRRVIVTGVVDTVAGQEIENRAAIRGAKFHSLATLIADVHLQNVEQPRPLRVHVLCVFEACSGSPGIDERH